jgi:hypothetical protein
MIEKGVAIIVLYQPEGPSGELARTIIRSANPPTIGALQKSLPATLNSGVSPDVRGVQNGTVFRSFWLGLDTWLPEDTKITPSDFGRTIVSVDPHVANWTPQFINTVIEGTPELQAIVKERRKGHIYQDKNDTEKFARTYDVFISHASEDKDAIARPLYESLRANGVSVWFDEARLELGDSLRCKIDEGLARCRFGIVILSPHFLEKEWPQRELDGLVARETVSGVKAILPIWHGLDRSRVIEYSPPLADRFAARSEEGVPAIVEKILRVLQR